MSASTTGQIIQQATAQLAKLDHNGLADSLRRLFVAEPVRWRQLLLFAGFWPEPSRQKLNAPTKQLSQTLACLMKAMQALLERDVDHTDTVADMMLTLQGFFVVQAYYGDIVQELKALKFGRAPAEVQIHRLVAFVESQAQTMQKQLLDMQAGEAVYDPLLGHAASVPSPFDNSRVSYGGAYEGLCESIELGLRLILHSHTLPATPTFQPAHSPFHDRDFTKFCALAGVWQTVSEVWANMRFRGWQWICDAEGRRGCVPDDDTAFIREHAASIRYELFLSQRILQQAADDVDSTAYLDRRQQLVQSITIPQAGESWDGQVNIQALREYHRLEAFKDAVEQYVDRRHYGPMVERVKVGSLGWREWCDGKSAMYCLADGIAEAAALQLPDDDLSCMRQVVVVHEDILQGILVGCGALTAAQALDFVNALRFDPKRKSLEIWDQPLIPCGEKSLFLVPTFIKAGNPARALENFVSEWGGASFDLRGTPFVNYVVKELHERSIARAKSELAIRLSDGSELEFDIVVWWEGYVLLLEAKCEKAVFSASDYHRAKAQIEKAIDQLSIRRSALAGVWSELREKAPSLGLPVECVGNERVLCIAITNIMDFTGYSRDDVVVTDDSCFFRFFGDRVIRTHSSDGHINEEVEPIRASEVPHPSELMPFLLNPAPMRVFTERVVLVPHVIPAITERSPGFFSVHAEFDPTREGGIGEWKPAFVSIKAYAIATMMCRTKQSVNLDELQQDQGLLDAAEELAQLGIIGASGDDRRLVQLKLQNPVCARLPDQRYAVGEDICGQMSWWLNRHFPDKNRLVSPEFASYLAKQCDGG